MRAIWNGTVVADSPDTIEVAGYVYFPRAAVRMDLLQPAAKNARDLQCPHGVQFYDVGDGPARGQRNAWSYKKPGAAMQRIGHWVGFWDQVEVTR